MYGRGFDLGEGIAIVDDIIYMLTWKEKKMMMFNSETLEVMNSRLGTIFTTSYSFSCISTGYSVACFSL